MTRRLIYVGLLLVAALGLAACSRGASPQPSATLGPGSGINGITLLSPHQDPFPDTAVPAPSALPGAFGMSSYVPYPRTVVLIRAAGGGSAGQVVARIRSDDQGLFRVALPPGAYVVTTNRNGYLARERVTVAAGAYSRVRILSAVSF